MHIKFYLTLKKDNSMISMDNKEFKMEVLQGDVVASVIFLKCLVEEVEDSKVLKKEKLN